VEIPPTADPEPAPPADGASQAAFNAHTATLARRVRQSLLRSTLVLLTNALKH
jgi:hypothetical protein